MSEPQDHSARVTLPAPGAAFEDLGAAGPLLERGAIGTGIAGTGQATVDGTDDADVQVGGRYPQALL